jgi:hypothetical protein
LRITATSGLLNIGASLDIVAVALLYSIGIGEVEAVVQRCDRCAHESNGRMHPNYAQLSGACRWHDDDEQPASRRREKQREGSSKQESTASAREGARDAGEVPSSVDGS